MTTLTKSKYTTFLVCSKHFWMLCHDQGKIPEPSPDQLFRMHQGISVGKLATKVFPKGMDVEERDVVKCHEKTKEALKLNIPLFEAGFLVDDLYARVDILRPTKDGYDIIEVKSGTKIKDEHRPDVAFQKYVLEKAGLKINKTYLMHINNQYVRDGDIDYKELFTIEPIDIKEALIPLEEDIKEMRKTAKGPRPTICLGKGCNAGIKCVIPDCHDFLPDGNVFELYNSRGKAELLLEGDIQKLSKVPDEFKLTKKQDVQVQCAKNNKIHLDKEELKKFLNILKEPIFYLDFEAFSTAVPEYDGVKPYTHIPFQFVVVREENEEIIRTDFLHDDKTDPREDLAKALIDSLEQKGPIIVYYQSFEKARIRELIKLFPKYKEQLDEILKRIVDLIIPFRAFHYYNPEQRGSCSLKAVLPAITKKDYKHLDIQGGVAASVAFLSMTREPLTKEQKEKIKQDLIKYCGLDTEGMLFIVQELRKLV